MAQEEVVESEVNDESEFDAAFNEIAEAREIVPDDDGDEVDEADDADEADDTGEAAELIEEAEDPYAGMTEEVKAKFIALEEAKNTLQHKIDSDDGRVRAYQQKVDNLSKEINAIRSGATSGPTMSQISQAMIGGDDDWAAFSQSYPDVAAAIDRRLEKAGKATETAVEETLKPVKEKAEKDLEAERQTENQRRVAAVAAEFPTWTEAVKTPDFRDWLDSQPLGVANLADSDDPRDASTLIGLYDSHLVANKKPSLRADPATGVEEDEVESVVEPQLTELERKRRKQLEDGATVASRKTSVNADGPATSEFEAAFEVFARKKERQRA
jgi:hypothetical protein